MTKGILLIAINCEESTTRHVPTYGGYTYNHITTNVNNPQYDLAIKNAIALLNLTYTNYSINISIKVKGAEYTPRTSVRDEDTGETLSING